MKYLNLYGGVGGNVTLLEEPYVSVTTVEYTDKIAGVYKELHSGKGHAVLIEEAHDYLLNNHDRFDFVWSSPPCQSHSKMVKATRHKSQARRYPDFKLYEEIVYLQHFFKGGWVVENVQPYYGALVPEGVHFTKVGRHCFWSNFPITAEDQKRPKGFITNTNTAGKEAMQDWLGFPRVERNVYYERRHCPAQIYRNAVHPLIGAEIFNCWLATKGTTT